MPPFCFTQKRQEDTQSRKEIQAHQIASLRAPLAPLREILIELNQSRFPLNHA